MSGAPGLHQPVSPEHHQQALAFLVTLWSGDVNDEERAALAAWRQASPAHERAWLAVQQLEQRLRSLPSESAGQALRAASQGDKRGRRNVLRGLALLGVGGTALHFARDSQAWQAMTADYSTAIGERRTLVLQDGSRVNMNTGSAMDVRFDATQRRIDLYQGELMITTAAEPGRPYRPFVVHTAHGVARALGTRFVVRQEGAQTQVAVYASAVEVTPSAGPALRLAAGQQTRFTTRQADTASALAQGGAAWVDGMLAAEQMRLGDFLAELGRYRQGVIRCDAAVANLRVSGMYPLRDTQAVLDALAQALPIRLTYMTRYVVHVQAR